MREMHVIKVVTGSVDQDEPSPEYLLRMTIDTIDAEGGPPDRPFLRRLRAVGGSEAEAVLGAPSTAIGHRSSTDIAAKFF
jgi:NTE family protein